MASANTDLRKLFKLIEGVELPSLEDQERFLFLYDNSNGQELLAHDSEFVIAFLVAIKCLTAGEPLGWKYPLDLQKYFDKEVKIASDIVEHSENVMDHLQLKNYYKNLGKVLDSGLLHSRPKFQGVSLPYGAMQELLNLHFNNAQEWVGPTTSNMRILRDNGFAVIAEGKYKITREGKRALSNMQKANIIYKL